MKNCWSEQVEQTSRAYPIWIERRLAMLYEEHIRGEYRKANKDDYLLYNTALRSLDKTIDALGRKRVEENVKLLRSLHRWNEEKCAGKITMPCPKPEGIQWEENKSVVQVRAVTKMILDAVMLVLIWYLPIKLRKNGQE